MGIEVILRAVGFAAAFPIGRGSWGGLSRIFIGVLLGTLFYSPGASILILPSVVLEPAVGFVCALPFLLQLSVVQMAVENFQGARGETIAALYDPSTHRSSTSAALLIRIAFLAMFFQLHGGEQLVSTFKRSVQLLPTPVNVFAMSNLGAAAVYVSGRAFIMAITISIPFLALFTMCDLSVGVLGKIISRLEGISSAFILKTAVGSVLLVLLLRIYGASGIVRLTLPLGLK